MNSNPKGLDFTYIKNIALQQCIADHAQRGFTYGVLRYGQTVMCRVFPVLPLKDEIDRDLFNEIFTEITDTPEAKGFRSEFEEYIEATENYYAQHVVNAYRTRLRDRQQSLATAEAS